MEKRLLTLELILAEVRPAPRLLTCA